jgi:hypothetical protein
MGRDLLACVIVGILLTLVFFKPEGSKSDAPYLYELAYKKIYNSLETK